MDVSYDAVTIAMGELNRERFESVAFWYIVLNTMLELGRCKVTTSDPLELVISKSCRKKVTELGIPLSI